MKVLATGATGTYAGLVVSALVARGAEVRALVHDPHKAVRARHLGATEIVEADLADRTSLNAAVAGVDGVFLITPAFHPDATQLGLNLIDAAIAAGVGKIVYNGVYHPSLPLVNHATTRPIEAALYESDLDFTILQPAMYLQGLDPAYQRALDSGTIAFPWSRSAEMTYVDYRDVAEAAAIAFTDERLSYGTFELAAGGMTSRIALAELMSSAAGTTITAEDLPRPSGSTPDQPAGVSGMLDAYDKHGFHGGNSLVLRTIVDHPPRSVADYVRELAARHDQPQQRGDDSDASRHHA